MLFCATRTCLDLGARRTLLPIPPSPLAVQELADLAGGDVVIGHAHLLHLSDAIIAFSQPKTLILLPSEEIRVSNSLRCRSAVTVSVSVKAAVISVWPFPLVGVQVRCFESSHIRFGTKPISVPFFREEPPDEQ